MLTSSRTLHPARILLSLLLLLAAGALQAAPFQLTVENGDGDGSYEPGTRVHVFADPYESATPGQAIIEPAEVGDTVRVFDRWIGDTDALEDPFSMRTALVMPSAAVSITAQYKDAPRWAPSRVISYFPQQHQGVIFVLHGRGGCGTSCIVEETAVHSFIDSATAGGYGVILLDALDRRGESWNSSTSPGGNLDMQRLAAVYKDFLARGDISAQDPVYLLGISAGGVFASLFDEAAQNALGVPVDAMALFVSPGHAEVMPTSTVPTLFALAQNDSTNGGGLNDLAFWHHNLLLDNGVPSQLWMQAPTPLNPNSFWAIEGLTQADSQAIFQGLKDGGLLDGDNFLLEDPDKSNWQQHVPLSYLSALYQNSINIQLLAAYAAHSFFPDFNHKILGFFANPSTEVTVVPGISGFDPAIGSAGTLVTISGDNFVGISDVSFNGVSANLIGDTPTSLLVSVPEGATTGPISVTNSAGTATSVDEFEVVSAPEITDMTPTRGPVGTVVTLTGSGLTGASSVTFGGIEAVFTVDSDTQITATVPDEAPRYSIVRVTTPGGRASPSKLFVVR